MQIGLLINEPFLFAYSKLFVSTVVWRQAMKESQKSKKVPGSIGDSCGEGKEYVNGQLFFLMDG